MNDMVSLKHMEILGSRLTLCDQKTLLAEIHRAAAEKNFLTILSGNVHAYNLAFQHLWLRRYFNQADIVRLDGAGVRLGARILGYHTPPRMTWAAFGWDLAYMAAEHGLKLYLLGSREGVAARAAEKLQDRFPALQIAGTQHGFFDKDAGSSENEDIIRMINASGADILIVGFGMPLQERWLSENRERLQVPVVMTGGAVFDYLSGEQRRGPKWMTENGFEWLARLLIEPRRLWKRYIIGNPLFLIRVLRQRFGVINLDR